MSLESIPVGLCQCGCGKTTAIATKNHTKDKHVKGQSLLFISGHNRRRPHKQSHCLTDVDRGTRTAVCSKCGPIDIYVSGKKRAAVCKKGIAEHNKQYQSERKSEYAVRARRYNLYKFFRLTPEEYEMISQYQRSHEVFAVLLGNGKTRDAVEHRHADGMIRGVMAPMLNRAYGLIENLYKNNTSAVLRALAEFHDNPPATIVLGEARYGIIGKAKVKKQMVYGPPDVVQTKKKGNK